jgi:prepilin-type N-terminal cleavage/methylation domain-containing protein
MKKFLRRRTKNGAFSLVEVSVVLIIVGIFIAGIFIADEMIKKFRITAAQSLTKSSP